MTVAEPIAQLEREVKELRERLHDLANVVNDHVLRQVGDEARREKQRGGKPEG